MSPPKILVLLGPTASGKTEFGLALAQALDLEIISADSMLVYKGMDIGTAKPSAEERALVPHHLIDILTPDQPFNAGLFQHLSDQAIGDIIGRGKNALLLGGTNLYLRGLVDGLIEIPAAPAEIKEPIYRQLEAEGVGPLYQQLSALDPLAAAELHPNDSSRIARALEVFRYTGRSIKSWQAEHAFAQSRYRPYYLCVDRSREELYQRINRRVELMVAAGLVQEVQGLLEQGYDPSLPSMRSIGYKQAVDFLMHRCDDVQMVSRIQQDSRRFAKKQQTWIRQLPQLHAQLPGAPEASLLADLKRFLFDEDP
ncbi:MAG: tRNA (adenosine(37)-N6)-dimethylallyltransferase MiaA [bacterium]|nr:tRNA (adenosine(37)-N6)-dimethylallyltransferase MiaA [bacterium]